MNESVGIEFPPGLVWVNAPEQSLHALRGRIALVAVVTPGSAWCLNLIDVVRRLQARYPEQLRAFIVVCPKFDCERDPRVLGKWINQHGIGLPVALDADFAFWKAHDIQSWPTTLLLDIDGSRHEAIVGDPRSDVIDASVAELLERHEGLWVAGEARAFVRAEPPLPLSFPLGLAWNGRHLYVADCGNNQVLECTPEGRVMRRFGSGNADFLDGHAGQAAFRRPTAVVALRDALYVTDAGNHALRRISLHDGDIDTVLGTGKPGSTTGGTLLAEARFPLDRPLGLAFAGFNQTLYIANAGTNQVLALDLGQRRLHVLAGSGGFGAVDGRATAAVFAHPVGLAVLGQSLLVTDQGASAVRRITLGSSEVSTLIGGEAYRFGDVDGDFAQALLQAPTALACDGEHDLLWLLDSGNDVLKRVRIGARVVERVPLALRLRRPQGLALGDGVLWLANTDAHEVLRIDLETGAATHVPIGE